MKYKQKCVGKTLRKGLKRSGRLHGLGSHTLPFDSNAEVLSHQHKLKAETLGIIIFEMLNLHQGFYSTTHFVRKTI